MPLQRHCGQICHQSSLVIGSSPPSPACSRSLGSVSIREHPEAVALKPAPGVPVLPRCAEHSGESHWQTSHGPWTTDSDTGLSLGLSEGACGGLGVGLRVVRTELCFGVLSPATFSQMTSHY